MGRPLRVGIAVIVLVLAPQVAAAPAASAPAAVQTTVADPEVARLRGLVEGLEHRLDGQQQAIQDLAQHPAGANATLVTAGGVVFAALLAGGFALWNQRSQARQARLLKAVELIMQSRSGYEADLRAQNLAMFLDEATKAHLTTIKDKFTGPEFTDLRVQLAEAMSAKAQTPAEVLGIWRAMLKGKGSVEKLDYLPARKWAPFRPRGR